MANVPAPFDLEALIQVAQPYAISNFVLTAS
jgi:hypothetical protein